MVDESYVGSIVHQEVVIRITDGYLAKGYAGETPDVACPDNLQKLTVEDLKCEIRREVQPGDGSGPTEVTGKGDPIWPGVLFWHKTKKDSAT